MTPCVDQHSNSTRYLYYDNSKIAPCCLITLLHHIVPSCCSLILLSSYTIKRPSYFSWILDFTITVQDGLTHIDSLGWRWLIHSSANRANIWMSCWCSICWLNTPLLLDLVGLIRLGGNGLIPQQLPRSWQRAWVWSPGYWCKGRNRKLPG